jgi:CBS domain-containing protein
MSSNPTTCQDHDMLDVVAQHMWDADVGVIPVIDPRGRLVGVITDRDVAMAAYTQGHPLRQISVRTAMSDVIHIVREDATLDDVQAQMQHHRVRRVPVVDRQGKVVGIVTLTDLARCVGGASPMAVTASEIVITLRTVCEPRGERHRDLAAQ